MKWLHKAADLGSAPAENRLGELYEHGIGVTADPRQAADWYRKAAEGGDPAAQYNLAMLYIRGLGVERSPAQMYFWLTLSAENGDIMAIHDLPALKEKMMNARDVHDGEKLVADYHAAHPSAGTPPAPGGVDPVPKN
jgi:TPR repeat protein